MASTRWTPDILGEEWSATTLPLWADIQNEPAPVATLVRQAPANLSGPAAAEFASRPAIFYVHGFADYFFQRHLSEFFTERGYAFYAIDLRRYGRSLQPGETPNYVLNLGVYREELDLAADVIKNSVGHERLIVMGHSAGGLVTSLWANQRSAPGPDHVVDALVLNSPWLDLNSHWFNRTVTTRLIDDWGRLAKRHTVGGLSRFYGEALHVSGGGEWDFDLELKPSDGFPVRAGWLRTIRRAQAVLANGLDIEVPVLMCTATRSGPSDRWHSELLTTDSVLDVADMLARAGCLGPDVTIEQFEGGAHDLALSPEPARTQYFTVVADWLSEQRGLLE